MGLWDGISGGQSSSLLTTSATAPVDFNAIHVAPTTASAPVTAAPASNFWAGMGNSTPSTVSAPTPPLSLYDQVQQPQPALSKLNLNPASLSFKGVQFVGDVIDHMLGLPGRLVTDFNYPQGSPGNESVPYTFSGQYAGALGGAAANAGIPGSDKVALGAGLLAGFIEPIPGLESSSALKLGNLTPEESKLAIAFADHINSGHDVGVEDWATIKQILTDNGYTAPNTQKQAAALISDAKKTALSASVIKEQANFNNALDEQMTKPATIPLKPKPVQPRQANGWWDTFKNMLSDQRGMIKNPLASSGEAPKPDTFSAETPATETTAAAQPQETANKVELPITGTTQAERVDSAIVNAERIKNEINVRGKDAFKAGQSLSPKDLELGRQVENGTPIKDIAAQADNPKQLTTFLTKLADYYDFRLAADRAAGGSTPKVENYIPHHWDLSNPEDLARFNDLAKQKGLQEYNGFRAQPRVFKSYAEGIAQGFKPANPSILEDLQHDYNAASSVISKQALRQGLYEAAPDKVSMSGYGQTPEGKPFINSNIPGLEGLSYDKSIHQQLKGFEPLTNTDVLKQAQEKGFNITDPKSYGTLWQSVKDNGMLNTVSTLYDHVNSSFKHTILNFSGFHSINISANYTGASIFNPIKGVRGLSTSLPSFFSEKITQDIIDGFKKKTVPGKSYTVFDAGLRSGVNMDRGLPPRSLTAKVNPFNTLSRAIFDRELYTLKLNLVDQAFGSGKLDPTSPMGRATAREINMIMGEMNQRTMNINPNTSKWLSRVLLAPQFTASKYKLIGDAITKGDEKGGNLARTAIVGKSLAIGTLSTFGTLLATGKFPNLHQILLNYTFAPSTQTNLKNPKGQSLDVIYPQTFVTEPAKPLGGALDAMGLQNPLGTKADLTHYGEARLAPALSTAIAAYNNQDFYGNPIVNPNVKQSALSQRVQNLGKGVLPIGVQAAVNQAQGKTTSTQTAINVAGLNTKVSAADPATVQKGNVKAAIQAIAAIAPDDPNRLQKMQAIFNSVPAASRKSLAYQELLAGVSTKGIYQSPTEQKYFQVQDLVSQGKTDQAAAITKAMTPQEYSTYKAIKTKLTNEAVFQKVKDLVSQGNTQAAQQLTASMTKEQYKSYLTWKKNNP